jgi:beta-glucosidase/6-phospho-beta-glucosidase/beta-galactosidase
MLALLKGHARAVAALRELDTVDADGDGNPMRVSLSHWADAVTPATHSVLDQFITASYDDFLNESLPRALTSGRVLISVPGAITIDEVVPGLANSVDFIALQYYRSIVIRADLGLAALSTQSPHANAQVNDLDWGIDADGLYQFLMRFKGYGLPLIVTENGIADGARTKRSRFLAQHVAALERARADGADVRGYLHWSLMDNFEWDSGYEGKFGLFSIDFAGGDLTRRETPAVQAFRQVRANLPR